MGFSVGNPKLGALSGSNFLSPTSRSQDTRPISSGVSSHPRTVSGGALRSISEGFKVNKVNGTMAFSVPVRTTPSRGSIHPELSLNYDAGSGNGIFGLGWSLSANTSISRRTTHAIPRYDKTDVFVGTNFADILIPVGEASLVNTGTRYYVQRFRPGIEDHRVRVERWTQVDDETEIHWRTITDENVTTLFGFEAQSRVASESSHIFTWLLSATYDPYGNVMYYRYKEDDDQGYSIEGCGNSPCTDNKTYARNKYLKSIRYGNTAPARSIESWKIIYDPNQDCSFELVLDYGEHDTLLPRVDGNKPWHTRQDCFSSRRSGFEIRTSRLCKRLLMFHHFPDELGVEDCLVTSMSFEYDQSPGRSLLTSIIQTGYLPQQSMESQPEAASLPPYHFEYSHASPLAQIVVKALDQSQLMVAPSSKASSITWTDLNQDGVAGILCDQGSGRWSYQRNLSALTKSAAFGPPSDLIIQPATMQTGDTMQIEFMSLSSAGSLDAVHTDAAGIVQGFNERRDSGWSDYQPIVSQAVIDSARGPWLSIDVTGDGNADMVLADPQRRVVSWHESLGPSGYAAERQAVFDSNGPAPGSPHDNNIVYTSADMSGDGLSDIVLITASTITFWPHQGYGNFGAAISTENPLLAKYASSYDPRRLRLADIDGTGTADLLYFPSEGGLAVSYNQCGASWSKLSVNESFPRIESIQSLSVIDLHGTGTTCVLWKGRDPTVSTGDAYLYADLVADGKPNLLKRYTNNLGLEGRVTYRPSTYFQTLAETAGSPWTSKLPFPVSCVEQTEEHDIHRQVLTRTNYQYRDGHYDTSSKEFCGFAYVEITTQQTAMINDVEQFIDASHDILIHHVGIDIPAYTPIEIESNIPRLEHMKPYVSRPDMQTKVERALRGMKLREIVIDDMVSSVRRIVDYSYAVSFLELEASQPICTISPRETVARTLALDKSGCKTEQNCVLFSNHMGQPLRTAHIVYGNAECMLSDSGDRQKQQETTISLIETSYTNNVDDKSSYRLAVPWRQSTTRCLSRITHQIKAIAAWEETARVSQNTWQDVMAVITHDSVTKLHTEQISEDRRYYRRGDLSGVLAEGVLEAFSVLNQSLGLVATNETMQAAYGDMKPADDDAVQSAMIEGGHIDCDGDGRWWAPSSKEYYSIDGKAELEQARQCFYTPRLMIDAFGNRQTTDYDRHYLMPTRIVDAVGNVKSYQYQYCHLEPVSIMDENGNCERFSYDCLGRRSGAIHLTKADAGTTPLQSFLTFAEDRISEYLDKPHSYEIALALIGHLDRIYISNAALGHDYNPSRAHDQPSAEVELVAVRSDAMTTPELTAQVIYLDGHGQNLQTVRLLRRSSQSMPKDGWRIACAPLLNLNDKEVKTYKAFEGEIGRFVPRDQVHTPVSHCFYDTLGDEVATINFDQTWTKTIHKLWSSEFWDGGDTINIPNPLMDEDVGPYFRRHSGQVAFHTWMNRAEISPMAKVSSQVYANTPETMHLDAHSRCFTSKVMNGNVEIYRRKAYDMHGNQIEVHDGLGRLVERCCFDLKGRVLRNQGMDYGTRWHVYDLQDAVLRRYKSSGVALRMTFDPLRRPTKTYLQDGQSGNERLVERMVYGEDQSGNESANLRSKLYQCYDQSGVQTFDSYDHKGSITCTTKEFAKAYKSSIDWDTAPEIEDTKHVTINTYDSAGRIIVTRNAHDQFTRRKYNLGGHVQEVDFQEKERLWQPYLVNATYSVDGEPVTLIYGNGITVSMLYDEATGRLLRRTTSRTKDGMNTASLLEDKCFSYDCMHRQIQVLNLAESDTYFRNNHIDASNQYTYDAIGRLVTSTGRELLTQNSQSGRKLEPYGPFTTNKNSASTGQMCRYTEMYDYDAANNILNLRHIAADDPSIAGWTRKYYYEERSCMDPQVNCNRPSRTIVGRTEDRYLYDGPSGSVGCISAMTGFSKMSWDHAERMIASCTQRNSTGPPETTWYVYDFQGTRVRKVVERAGTMTKMKDTLFLPSVDISCSYSGNGIDLKTSRVSSQVEAGFRIASVEYNSSSTLGSSLIRYQPNDNLELDDKGGLVSYEEHSPHGNITYTNSEADVEAPRKYRWASYERDVETGFYHCGKRYYAPWLGLWTSSDPLFTAGSLNGFDYASCDPVNFDDPGGTESGMKVYIGGIRFTFPLFAHQSPAVLQPTPRNELNNVASTKAERSQALVTPTTSQTSTPRSAIGNVFRGHAVKGGFFSPVSFSIGRKLDNWQAQGSSRLRNFFNAAAGVHRDVSNFDYGHAASTTKLYVRHLTTAWAVGSLMNAVSALGKSVRAPATSLLVYTAYTGFALTSILRGPSTGKIDDTVRGRIDRAEFMAAVHNKDLFAAMITINIAAAYDLFQAMEQTSKKGGNDDTTEKAEATAASFKEKHRVKSVSPTKTG